MRTQRSADIVSGILLSLLGLAVVLAALRISGSPDVRMQPRALPLILGWVLLASGGILAVRAWHLRGQGQIIKWPDPSGTARVLVTLASLTVCLLLMDPLGLPFSTVVFVAFLVWYLGHYRMLWAVALGLASGATVYFVFIRLLQLSFPVGPLGR